MFESTIKLTKFYAYRTAVVTGITIHPSDEDIKAFKCFLRANGYAIDNHICVTLDNDGLTTHLMWSDGKFRIGAITIMNW